MLLHIVIKLISLLLIKIKRISNNKIKTITKNNICVKNDCLLPSDIQNQKYSSIVLENVYIEDLKVLTILSDIQITMCVLNMSYFNIKIKLFKKIIMLQ